MDKSHVHRRPAAAQVQVDGDAELIALQHSNGLSIGTDASGTRLFDGYSIPSDTARTFWCYHALTNAEIVQAFAGTNNAITLTLSGEVFS